MSLKPHETRVVDEHTELCTRLGKLKVFLRSPAAATLSQGELVLLGRQSRVMAEYADILSDRITLMKDPHAFDGQMELGPR